MTKEERKKHLLKCFESHKKTIKDHSHMTYMLLEALVAYVCDDEIQIEKHTDPEWLTCEEIAAAYPGAFSLGTPCIISRHNDNSPEFMQKKHGANFYNMRKTVKYIIENPKKFPKLQKRLRSTFPHLCE